MHVVINGEPQEIAAATLDAALTELGYATMRVATAVDGDFVPAAGRAACALTDGVAIEIVAPMQGG